MSLGPFLDEDDVIAALDALNHLDSTPHILEKGMVTA